MTSEVIIDVQPKEISIALLEDKNLVEYQNEKREEASYSVGNIYLGKVRKLMPGLNACFVDVGSERDAFLHYLDLGTQFSSYEKYLKQVQSDKKNLYPIAKATRQPDLPKEGSITMLKQGQEILVQVVKEPINTKGPRLSCDISFAGRYMVLIPFGDKVSVSSKIKKSEERARLKQLVQSIRPKNFGVIVRTSAEGKRVAELDNELKTLMKRWEDMITKAQKATKTPQLCFEETGRAVAMLRDLFDPTYDGIYVNDADIMNQVKDYVSMIAPEKKDIVKLYTGTVPIFDNFNVTKQIKSSFGKTVNYKRGAYLIIQSTEAIDFIDMNLAEDRQLLYERMCKNMQKDRARHNILPLSKFGLMQITRQRVRPAMDVNVEETCPTCFGKGKIKSSILFTDQLESKIDRLVNKIGIRTFSLHVHPYVAAYINKGLWSLKRQWQMKYGWGIRIVPSQKLAFLQYEFYDKERQFIDMQEDIETNS